jgi:hypothetical protein
MESLRYTTFNVAMLMGNIIYEGKQKERAMHTISKTLVYVLWTHHLCFEYCNETKLIAVVLALYICMSIIGYGQFVYKPSIVSRDTV